ncbi:MAG: endopeptidase La, partial [Acidobacteriota bacterium]
MSKSEPKTAGDGLISIPLVPLRDIVVFPSTMMPFIVGRSASLCAFDAALEMDKRLFLATQRDARVDNPGIEDINSIGTIATVVQHQKLPNGNVKVLVEGIDRARVIEVEELEDHQLALLKRLEQRSEVTRELREKMKRAVALFETYVKLSPHLPQESFIPVGRSSDPSKLVDTIASNLQVGVDVKQNLLETLFPAERVNALMAVLEAEVDKLRVDRKIHNKVKKQMEKAQKEYYLNEKMKAIQKELGGREDRASEIEELKAKIGGARMPKDAREKAMQEVKRLEVMPPVSAEATVSRNYLDWLVSLPWRKKTRESRDIDRAAQILDEDHYGLKKIKGRILEFLAVRQLVKKSRGSILCFVGPPGVGKTSLGRSIARATSRKFVRLSLGGVRDEAEIRGHRRTYIGAFPGQIVQMLKKAGSRNPVLMLDEVDKMSTDFRGDPSAALLEVLDPELNHQFQDHYIDTEVDLSEVMFLCTANVLHTIPAALKDRMEVLRLAGYTLREKMEIARQFLVPKQLTAHGLQPDKVGFDDETLQDIIERYTREAGVRNLEREIASVCRKIAMEVVRKKGHFEMTVTPERLAEYLGVPQFRRRELEKSNEVGVATGLAWTESGGEILSTEATLMKGKGNLSLTGKLGDVMKESAQAALSFIRSRCAQYGIDENFHRKYDMHVHVPEGAIPKDGPSAGITIATSLTSALTSIPVRGDVAMTGEITLRGKVLPVGGVKEKILAAHRVGITTLILPKDNQKDLSELPDDIQEAFDIRFVETVDEVFDVALESELARDKKIGGGGFPDAMVKPVSDDRMA